MINKEMINELITVAAKIQNINDLGDRPIWLDELRKVADEIEKQESIETAIALKILEPIWRDIDERYMQFVRQQVKGTTFEWMETNEILHPLKMDRTLLSETQWVDDEPTLTRLLASLICKDSIFRGAVFYYLFKNYIPELNSSVCVEEFCKMIDDGDANIDADTEKYGLEKEDGHEKKRRADIIIYATVKKKEYQIFIEAKVKSQRDNEQLKDMAQQFIDENRNDEHIWLFLSNEDDVNDEDNNGMNGSNEGLINQWKNISWQYVVTGLEKSLKYYQLSNGDDYRYIWLKFFIGAMWHGTLGVKPDPARSVFSLFSNKNFRAILQDLNTEEV
jgi:hypothetical protein